MHIRAETTIRVPPGTPLILTFEQAQARAHLLKFNQPVCLAFGPEDYQEDAIATSDQPLEFKRGEILEVRAIPKGWAGQITVLKQKNPEEEPKTQASERQVITPPSDEANTGAEASAPAPEQPTVEEAAPPASADAPESAEGQGETSGAESAAQEAAETDGEEHRQTRKRKKAD